MQMARRMTRANDLRNEKQRENLDFGEQVETFERCKSTRRSLGFDLAEFSEYAQEQRSENEEAGAKADRRPVALVAFTYEAIAFARPG